MFFPKKEKRKKMKQEESNVRLVTVFENIFEK